MMFKVPCPDLSEEMTNELHQSAIVSHPSNISLTSSSSDESPVKPQIVAKMLGAHALEIPRSAICAVPAVELTPPLEAAACSALDLLPAAVMTASTGGGSPTVQDIHITIQVRGFTPGVGLPLLQLHNVPPSPHSVTGPCPHGDPPSLAVGRSGQGTGVLTESHCPTGSDPTSTNLARSDKSETWPYPIPCETSKQRNIAAMLRDPDHAGPISPPTGKPFAAPWRPPGQSVVTHVLDPHAMTLPARKASQWSGSTPTQSVTSRSRFNPDFVSSFPTTQPSMSSLRPRESTWRNLHGNVNPRVDRTTEATREGGPDTVDPPAAAARGRRPAGSGPAASLYLSPIASQSDRDGGDSDHG